MPTLDETHVRTESYLRGRKAHHGHPERSPASAWSSSEATEAPLRV